MVGFDELWAVWPSKHQRPKAKDAYKKLKPDQAEHAQLVAAAQSWAEHYQSNGVDKRWIPLLHNWLQVSAGSRTYRLPMRTRSMVRKQPSVYAELSAIYYRPWQFWNIMITAQEYLIADKILFGTDFPFSTVENSLAGIRAVNDVVAGTRLPRVSPEVIEGIIHANPFAHWWHGPAPV
jgi:hypothetical protein